MISPRRIHEQFSGKLGTKFSQRLLLQQDFAIVTVIQKLCDREADQQRVLDSPYVWSVNEKSKLDGQSFAMLGDIGIHAVGVGLQLFALHRIHPCDHLFRDLP